MIKAIELISKNVQKYAFSKRYGKPVALVVLVCMIILFLYGLYGSDGDITDPENIFNGWAYSFSFAMVTYAVLYTLAYEPTLGSLAVCAYSVAYFLESIPLAQDIFNGIGGLTILLIFGKWASRIKNPNKKVHKDDF